MSKNELYTQRIKDMWIFSIFLYAFGTNETKTVILLSSSQSIESHRMHGGRNEGITICYCKVEAEVGRLSSYQDSAYYICGGGMNLQVSTTVK